MKFCLDSLDLLWMINSVSHLAKKNTCRNNETCLQSKETEERKCNSCAQCSQDFESTGQIHGSISCSTIHVYLIWLLKALLLAVHSHHLECSCKRCIYPEVTKISVMPD